MADSMTEWRPATSPELCPAAVRAEEGLAEADFRVDGVQRSDDSGATGDAVGVDGNGAGGLVVDEGERVLVPVGQVDASGEGEQRVVAPGGEVDLVGDTAAGDRELAKADSILTVAEEAKAAVDVALVTEHVGPRGGAGREARAGQADAVTVADDEAGCAIAVSGCGTSGDAGGDHTVAAVAGGVGDGAGAVERDAGPVQHGAVGADARDG